MTDPLKPCPLCGGPGEVLSEYRVFCDTRGCHMSKNGVTLLCWQALPRREEEALVAELLAALESVERSGYRWEGDVRLSCCPACSGTTWHPPNCQLAAAIAKAKGEVR